MKLNTRPPLSVMPPIPPTQTPRWGIICYGSLLKKIREDQMRGFFCSRPAGVFASNQAAKPNVQACQCFPLTHAAMRTSPARQVASGTPDRTF